MKEIIIDNIATNSTIKTGTVRELVDRLENAGLAKTMDNDYVFSEDYNAINKIVEKYDPTIVGEFLSAVKTENRITILNHGEHYFD